MKCRRSLPFPATAIFFTWTEQPLPVTAVAVAAAATVYCLNSRPTNWERFWIQRQRQSPASSPHSQQRHPIVRQWIWNNSISISSKKRKKWIRPSPTINPLTSNERNLKSPPLFSPQLLSSRQKWNYYQNKQWILKPILDDTKLIVTWLRKREILQQLYTVTSYIIILRQNLFSSNTIIWALFIRKEGNIGHCICRRI